MTKIILFFLLITDIFPGKSGTTEWLENKIVPQEQETEIQEEIKQPEVPPFKPLPFKTGLPSEPIINAKSALITDLDTDTRLYVKEAATAFQIASLTKLMTALLCVNFQPDLTKTVEVSDLSLTRSSDATMGLILGEKISYQHLLEGLLINSASDAAVTLAQSCGMNYQQFITEMNLEAQRIGMKTTKFDNPVGWDSSQNFSSTEDLTLLSRVVLKNQNLRNIIKIKEKVITTATGQGHLLINTNSLLDGKKYFGVKTGFTYQAGGCLISLVNIKDKDVLIVIVGAGDRFEEVKNLEAWTELSYNW